MVDVYLKIKEGGAGVNASDMKIRMNGVSRSLYVWCRQHHHHPSNAHHPPPPTAHHRPPTTYHQRRVEMRVPGNGGVETLTVVGRLPEAPIWSRRGPKACESARNIEPRSTDHTVRRDGSGVGGSERRKAGGNDVEVIAPLPDGRLVPRSKHRQPPVFLVEFLHDLHIPGRADRRSRYPGVVDHALIYGQRSAARGCVSLGVGLNRRVRARQGVGGRDGRGAFEDLARGHGWGHGTCINESCMESHLWMGGRTRLPAPKPSQMR